MEAVYVNVFILCLQFGAISVGCSSPSSWTAEVPSRVSGLLGSCVVIPCSFTYPPLEGLGLGPAPSEPMMTGMWAEPGHHLVYHPDGSKVTGKYRNRTSLLGDLGRGRCSLRIDPLGEADGGPFHFRIEIKDHDRFSYMQSQVSITLTSSPQPMAFRLREEEVLEGDNVSASCSVTHSCPSDPPTFSWSRPGHTHLRSVGLADGRWNATSTLSFRAAREDHGRPLGCTVTYRGGLTQSSPPAALRVKYPPVNVRVSYNEAGVSEGADVTLSCSSVANPPAHVYRWYGAPGGDLRYTGHVFTLRRVTRRDAGDVYCTATNTEGHGTSETVRVTVLYPPEIKAGSACSSDSLKVVTCVCIVDSRPASTIHWSLPDGRHHAARPGGSELETHGAVTIDGRHHAVRPGGHHEAARPGGTELETHGMVTIDGRHHEASRPGGSELQTHGVVTIGTLQVEHGAPGPAHCHARNSQGNATAALAFPSDDHTSLMLYVAAAIGGLFVLAVIILTALRVTKKCGSRGNQQTSNMHGMNETKSTEQHPPAPTRQEAVTDSMVFCNVYTNDHLYGNIEADVDDDPYECAMDDNAIYANV